MDKIVLNDELLKSALCIYQENYFKRTVFNEEEYKTTKAFDKKINKIIKSENSLYHSITLTTFRKAICIIVALLILLLSSLTVGAVREAIAGFFMQVFSHHSTITAGTAEDNVYPTKIETAYELGYVPQGYELMENISDSSKVTCLYLNGETPLIFEQWTKNNYLTNHDNESSEYKEEAYKGNKYLVISYADNTYDVIWDNGAYIFNINAHLDKQEIFDILNSLKPKAE